LPLAIGLNREAVEPRHYCQNLSANEILDLSQGSSGLDPDGRPEETPRHSLQTLTFRYHGEIDMAMNKTLILAGSLMIALASPALAQVDADAAQKLAKKNDCFKCHAVDKTKKGPSLKKIAAKYKGKPDGQEKAIKNMTTGSKVKLEDGTEEDHKIIDTKDPKELKNLADWILSQ
jgi:cytochrome c